MAASTTIEEAFRGFQRLYCAEHAELRYTLIAAAGYSYWGVGCPPKWWRRRMNRKYKRRMNVLVRAGRDEECYDQPREEAYYW